MLIILGHTYIWYIFKCVRTIIY